jgi:L-threonylcarbamoyladenylate synthase
MIKIGSFFLSEEKLSEISHFGKKMENELPSVEKIEGVETKIFVVESECIDDNLLANAVKLLKGGDVVAFPTETVYGLGANALDASAVAKIFKTKGRPSDNPLIVHISSLVMLKDLISEDALPTNGIAEKILNHFWPGPLTILLKKSSKVPTAVTAGLDFVAVRMPSHPIARRLIELSNLPIAAPSANLSGKPSPTTASHVFDDLKVPSKSEKS